MKTSLSSGRPILANFPLSWEVDSSRALRVLAIVCNALAVSSVGRASGSVNAPAREGLSAETRPSREGHYRPAVARGSSVDLFLPEEQGCARLRGSDGGDTEPRGGNC